MTKQSTDERRMRKHYTLCTYLAIQLVPVPVLLIIKQNIPTWLFIVLFAIVSSYALLCAKKTHTTWTFTTQQETQTGDDHNGL